MKKAILIDSKNQTVTETEIGDYKDIYAKIGNGCTLFAIPVEFENGDALYVDDEGLLHEKVEGCFMLEGWAIPIVGNAIIWGTDEEGDSQDCKTTVDDIKAQIKFFDNVVAENYRVSALGTQPVVISF